MSSSVMPPWPPVTLADFSWWTTHLDKASAMCMSGALLIMAFTILHNKIYGETPDPKKFKRSGVSIGIMGAMPPEIAMLQKHVEEVKEYKVNDALSIFKGHLHGKTVVFASAGVGTVFAATTATAMVTMFNVDVVVFTGVAGGLLADQKVGDIVIGKDCVNYDMDVTAFVPFPGCRFSRGQLPFINWLEYPADPQLLKLALAAPLPASFKGTVTQGRIATGSVFVTVPKKIEFVKETKAWGLGSCAAVEMECASVAQVCKSFERPFLGLRALSDVMKGDANDDFNAFTQFAADNLWPIVSSIVEHYKKPIFGQASS